MIYNIQVLRALAAISVVVFHLPDFGFLSPQGVVLRDKIISTGAAGVDLFFVISGFIIIYSYTNNPISVSNFIWNRATRIIPTYWIVTVFWFCLLAIASSHFRDNYLDVSHLVASMLFSSQLLGYGDPFIVPGWTLEFEMLFYLFFALCVFFSRTYFWVGVSLCLLGFSIFSGKYIVLEFALGMVAFWLFRISIPTAFYKTSLAIGVFLLVASGIYELDLSETGSQFGFERFTLWGVPSFFLLVGCTGVRQLNSPVLTLLGNASYSIYVVHGVVISVFSDAVGASFSSGPVALAAQFGCLFFCIISGVIFYLLFERPLLALCRRRSVKAKGTSS